MNEFANFNDYYNLLEIDPSATSAEIRTAYRKIIRKIHPDINRSDPNADALSKEINRAYEVLSDEAQRQVYDREYRAYKESLENSKVYELPLILNQNEAYYGINHTITIDGQEVSVQIPAGVDTDDRLQFQVPLGTLYLIITVIPDPRIRRNGIDLYLDCIVDLFIAVLGGEIFVSIFNDGLVVKVPPGTSSDQPLRIRYKGMPSLKEPKRRGSLYVRLLIKVPRNLSEEQQLAFRKLAKSFQRGPAQ